MGAKMTVWGKWKATLFVTITALVACAGIVPSIAVGAGAPQWLVSGEPIQVEHTVSAEIKMSGTNHLLLEDMNAVGKPDILCEVAKTSGALSFNGQGEVTGAECAKPTVDSGTCESPKVSPANLPWQISLAEHEGGTFEAVISSMTGSGAGWTVECTVLGIKATDTCVTNDAKMLLTNTAEGLVEDDFAEEATKEEEAACSLGGAEEGLEVGPSLIEALNASKEKVTLSVSSGTEAFVGPSWLVKGARLGSGAKKTVSTFSTAAFGINALALKVMCKKFNYSGEILGSAANRVGTGNGTIIFSECEEELEKGCEVFSVLKKGTEMSPKGQIGPLTVTTELAYPMNVRFQAYNVFTSREENAKNEPVFTVVLFEKKPPETCSKEGQATEIAGLNIAARLQNGTSAQAPGAAGELARVGLGTWVTPRGEVEVWNSTTSAYMKLQITLTYKVAVVTLSGSATLELSPSEAFGWLKE